MRRPCSSSSRQPARPCQAQCRSLARRPRTILSTWYVKTASRPRLRASCSPRPSALSRFLRRDRHSSGSARGRPPPQQTRPARVPSGQRQQQQQQREGSRQMRGLLSFSAVPAAQPPFLAAAAAATCLLAGPAAMSALRQGSSSSSSGAPCSSNTLGRRQCLPRRQQRRWPAVPMAAAWAWSQRCCRRCWSQLLPAARCPVAAWFSRCRRRARSSRSLRRRR